MEKTEPWSTVGGNADWCSHCGKWYSYLKKLKMELHSDLAIPLLVLYPKNPETPIRKNLHPTMLIVALFTIAKIWKQPKMID